LAARDPGSHHESFSAGLMVLPNSVPALQELIQFCRDHQLPIITQGGRTGLVGGTVSSPV